MLKTIFKSPARATLLAFALMILLGTILFMLPQSSNSGSLGFIDALFTATSAVCVTGLSTISVVNKLSHFGQLILIILIQSGGLGIMTISTLFLMAAGKRLSLLEYSAVQDTFVHDEVRSIPSVLKDIFFFTFVLEGIGAILLFFCFKEDYTVEKAIYLSIFHSISGFCNAGFSLFNDSFSYYKNSWLLNLTICFLIIMGGVGFLVLSELKHYFKMKHRKLSRLSLHTKLVLSTTIILLIISTLVILFMEDSNTLANLSSPQKILVSFFQAVNSRTAGFNTVPIGNMANETLFILMILMFIGASPGSCAGGIKTTTFATLILLGLSRLSGHERPQIFNRSISEKSIGKAISILIISVVVVFLGIMFLLMTELGEVSHVQTQGKFLELFFEVVSAFGTVGLSTGVTAGLSSVGKIIITCIMFIGRLGPLLVTMAISKTITLHYFYAEEDIMIG